MASLPRDTEEENSIRGCVRKYADSDAKRRDLEEINAGEPKLRLQMTAAYAESASATSAATVVSGSIELDL